MRESRDPAMLTCQFCESWQMHTYSREVPVVVEPLNPVVGAPEVDEMYTCERCGEERVWGRVMDAGHRNRQKRDSKRAIKAREGNA